MRLDIVAYCSVLFFSRPSSEGWPQHAIQYNTMVVSLVYYVTGPARHYNVRLRSHKNDTLKLVNSTV